MALRDKSSIPEIRVVYESHMSKRYKGEAKLPPELRAQKVVLLKRIGKVLGVKDYSKMKRAELIQVLYEHLNANPPTEYESIRRVVVVGKWGFWHTLHSLTPKLIVKGITYINGSKW